MQTCLHHVARASRFSARNIGVMPPIRLSTLDLQIQPSPHEAISEHPICWPKDRPDWLSTCSSCGEVAFYMRRPPTNVFFAIMNKEVDSVVFVHRWILNMPSLYVHRVRFFRAVNEHAYGVPRPSE